MIEIFLDCDEVVADWRGYVEKTFNRRILTNERLPPEQWARLKDDQRMYAKLELKEGAIELVNWCRDYQAKNECFIAFLTAIPQNNDMPYAAQDKVWWTNKYFPGIPCFIGPYAHEKVRRCKGNDSILIDDRLSSCTDWRAAGGRAHQYKNWEECKLWLEQELL